MSRTFVGKGKFQEITEYIEENDIDLLIFDDELSPSQLRNLGGGVARDQSARSCQPHPRTFSPKGQEQRMPRRKWNWPNINTCSPV